MFERANPHLAGIVTPERRLSAEQVVRYLQGIKHVAFSWGTGVVFMVIEPSSMWAYGFHPENFAP